MHGFRVVFTIGVNADFAAGAGGQHHQAHDALAVDRLAVLLDEHFAVKEVGRLDEQGGGPGVDAQLVHHDQFLFDLGGGVSRLVCRTHAVSWTLAQPRAARPIIFQDVRLRRAASNKKLCAAEWGG